MPRQRKPQNGGQRIGTWRVANTTTGSTTTQAVYRIPTGKRYGECEVLNYEVVGTDPVKVNIEWSNVYRISLVNESLQSVIEDMSLNLDTVTLSTINWDVAFTGSIVAQWWVTTTALTATDVSATTLDTNTLMAESGEITNLTSTTWNINTLTSTTLNTDTITAAGAANLQSTLSVGWLATLLNGADVTGEISTDTLAVQESWVIPELTSTTITTETLSASGNVSVLWTTTTNWISNTGDITNSGSLTNSGNASIGGSLSVAWESTFTGAASFGDIISNWQASLNNVNVLWTLSARWATTLSSTLTVLWDSTLGGNTSIGWNLAVAGNETITGNSTVLWDGIFSNNVNISANLNVGWDTTIADDLNVSWTTHLKWLETQGDVDITWVLRTTGAAHIGNWLHVDGQIESDTVRTAEIITDEARITTGIYLSAGAEAPDFVLQTEKNQPNGIATLNSEGKIDTAYLPEVFTTAKVKIVQWVFNNSDTAVVVDEDITNDSAVIVTNYQDIVWDTNEVISVWQVTVVSNATETGSFKVVIFKPVS